MKKVITTWKLKEGDRVAAENRTYPTGCPFNKPPGMIARGRQ
jgi:hypothetical protein